MVYQQPGQGNILHETLVMLLNGWGYNWYRADNQRREDDILVRQHAGHYVIEAAVKLQAQEAEYHRRFLPEPSREQPFPPRERLATHRLIRDTRQDILALEGRIRGQTAPPTDRVWMRFRREVATLEALVNLDLQLISLSQQLDSEAGRLRAELWDDESNLQPLLGVQREIGRVLEQRAQFLLGPEA